MADILIRGLSDKTVRRLRARAERHGRSLQSEVKMLLEQVADTGVQQVAAILNRWERRFRDRKFANSARMIRKDRDK